jgi:hypothetical protein
MLNKININHKYIKCFQFNWVAWSNLYLGKVPLTAIANIHNNTVLKITIK